jgi:LPS-assembly protein
MQLNLSPNGMNPKRIPNEDSRLSELDDTNLFFLSRMNGLDRTDSGNRFVYGLNQGFYGPGSTRLFWFLGQSQRLNPNKSKIIGDSRGYASNYVTRVQIYPSDFLKIHYRGRFTQQGTNRLSEVTTNIGKPIFYVGTTYIAVHKDDTPLNQPIRQLNFHITSRLSDHWRVTFSQNQNLVRSQKNSRAHMASLGFDNDCFEASLGIFQTQYRDRDLRPDSGFLLTFSFKNLGTFKPLSSSTASMTTRRL